MGHSSGRGHPSRKRRSPIPSPGRTGPPPKRVTNLETASEKTITEKNTTLLTELATARKRVQTITDKNAILSSKLTATLKRCHTTRTQLQNMQANVITCKLNSRHIFSLMLTLMLLLMYLVPLVFTTGTQ